MEEISIEKLRELPKDTYELIDIRGGADTVRYDTWSGEYPY